MEVINIQSFLYARPCLSWMLKCGIDEAGRGPILGPMVMAGVVLDEDIEAQLKDIGVKDSKLMTAKQRVTAAEVIKRIVTDYEIVIVTPEDIDKSVFSEADNINWLEARTAARIITKLKPDSVVVDCPSPNTRAYHAYVEKHLNFSPEILCTHHADRDHVAVAAASVLAKTTRDAEVAALCQKLGFAMGSGYLHDPATKAFFAEHWQDCADVFRKSWKPYKDALEALSQTRLV